MGCLLRAPSVLQGCLGTPRPAQEQKASQGKNQNKNKSGLELFGNCEATEKPNCGILTRTYVVCHGREATLAVPNLSTQCHVSFTAFSACDSIYKHPCLTLVLCGRMSFALPAALCPSPGTWLNFRPLSAALGPQLPYSHPVQTCAANTNSSAWQPRMPNPKGIAGVQSSTICIYIIYYTYYIYIYYIVYIYIYTYKCIYICKYLCVKT